MMRGVGDLIAIFVLGVLVGTAVSSTLENWSLLVETGGWFAVLGHFLAVAATLAMIVVAAALALALLALPILVYYAVTEPGARDLATLADRVRSPLRLRRAAAAALGRAALALAEPVWKALWWGWWYLSGRASAREDAAGE